MWEWVRAIRRTRRGGRGEEDDGGDENVDEEGAARERL
jgi:hypothetical protein